MAFEGSEHRVHALVVALAVLTSIGCGPRSALEGSVGAASGGGGGVQSTSSGSSGGGGSGGAPATTATSSTASGSGGESPDGGMPDDGGPNVVYAGYNLFTHVPRFVIFKSDKVRDICVQLTISAFGPGTLAIDTTPGSAVENVIITNHASDCAPPAGFPAPPIGESATPTSATGTLVINGGFPCDVSLHATLFFAPGAPWVPASEPLDVDALPVDGGCN